MSSPVSSAQRPPAPEWYLWQLLDSAFPTGSFSHSAGLEAAVQFGQITSAYELTTFLHSLLLQTAYASVPYLLASHTLMPEDAGARTELDRRYDTTLANHVANRASRQQGQALLYAAECLQTPANTSLTTYRTAAVQGLAPAHLPIALGLILALFAIPRDQAIRMFLFTTVRTALSAAVRLGVIGPMQAQNLQRLMAQEMERVYQLARHLTLDDAAQTSPFIDLFQGAQDRLYSRLFQS